MVTYIKYNMTPDEKELLEKTHSLAQENNKILRSIRSSNRWSSVFRVIYWIIIIGASIGAFYYIQPYANLLLKEYSIIQTDLNNVKIVTSKLPSLTGSSK